MILPGGTIGILGGGQLGRMLIQAGRPMGYRFHIFCPEAESTAGRIADTFTQANYDDFEALERFAALWIASPLNLRTFPLIP